jgi:putative transposase
MRKTPLGEGEYYHIYNRGVDKRTIFQDQSDLNRFFESIKEFNCVEPIGSIFLHSFDKSRKKNKKLVEIVAYCLNPNHYHFILRQLVPHGISEFMKRLSGGYTQYFNLKHKRNGTLFQGKFKSSHIDSDEYLLHASIYVNLNNRFNGKVAALSKSSWGEYLGEEGDYICNTSVVLEQFRNVKVYEELALSSLEDIIKRKELEKELEF